MPVDALEPFPTDWQRAVVVVAHPDDVEYGLSAAVAAWTSQGRTVDYVLVTRGEAGIAGLAPAEAGPLREAEQRAACDAVGVRALEFLDHPDGRIEEGLALRRDIAGAIRRATPDVVVTINHLERWSDEPGAGLNTPDHRAVGRAALDAVADAANEWIFPELTDAGLAPWSGVRWRAIAASPRPTHGVEVGAHLDAAIASLAAHRRYLEALDPSTTPEDYATHLVHQMTEIHAAWFGGRPVVALELI